MSTAPLSEGLSTAAPFFEALRLSTPVEVFLTLSALSVLPLLFIALTTFTRNIVVLSFLRQALGLQQSPPNMVLIVLAFFLTLFTMKPVLETAYEQGLGPYMQKHIGFEVAMQRSWIPMRDFLLRQTRESDLAIIHEISKQPIPKVAEAVQPIYLVPAFLLSELKTSFQIGFVILLPFLLIDLVVASILMSLGMIMVPPMTLSLPLKIMLFVVVDGWALIAKTLLASVIN